MIGSTISQYRILSELGRGGMGVVYEAHDEKLDRRVALKFIASHLTSDATAKERFVREAKAAAMLQHDAICAIYDVNEAPDGSTYIVMPLYQGVVLKELIARGPIASERALSFTRQIASGLRAAHAKGLVHRDIKPGNILVTNEDRIKILDFGLAKLMGEADLTVSHSTVGTMAYMSPEQVQGQKVDDRSDLWSVGVILYEMLTSRRPFTGEYDAAVVYGIVNQPLDLTTEEIPAALVPLLESLLEKEPFKRMGSADELVKAADAMLGGSGESSVSTVPDSAAIRTAEIPQSGSLSSTPIAQPASAATPSETGVRSLPWRAIVLAAAVVVLVGLWAIFRTDPTGDEPSNPAVSNALSALPSVAVMYIENNTPRDRLGDVIRDMLARNLGRADSIREVSNQRLKDILVQETGSELESVNSVTATRVARHAGIQSMILGSIVQLGSEYILEVELSDVESGNIIDAVSVTAATEGDIMEAVNEVTTRILTGTGSMFASENGTLRIQEVSTSSLSAYELYEIGQDHVDHWRFAQAFDAYKAAIAVDSTFVAAYVGASQTAAPFGFSPTVDLRESRSFLDAAKRHLASATEKERRYVELQSSESFRPEDVQKLADAYPDDKGLQFEAALVSSGETKFTYYNRAFELDPSFAGGYNMLAYDQLFAGRFDEAVSSVRRYMALQPDVPNTMDSGWEVMTSAGLENEALAMLEKSLEAHPDWPHILWRQAYTKAIAGDTTGTWEIMDAFAETTASPDYFKPYRKAHLALAYGQWERARILSATALREARRFKSDRELLYDLRNHAAVLHAVGRHEDAERILEEAVEISREAADGGFNPMPVLAAYQNGLGYADAGDIDRLQFFLEQLNGLLDQPGVDGRHRRYQILLQAHLAILQGDIPGARKLLPALPGITMLTPDSVRMIAWIEGLEGTTDKALEHFHFLEHSVLMRGFELAAYASFFIDHATARYETARMFDERGESDEALRRYRDALAEWEKTGADFRYVELARARVTELSR